MSDLYRYLPDMGLPLYEVFNEHGAGQVELNMEPGRGVQALDRAVLMKLAVKEIATRHGLKATFMSKPSNDPHDAASGFHLHQSLVTADSTPVFADGVGATPLAKAYMGGQLRHANALTLFAASTITSYKRFLPGTWAPIRAAWGYDNRSAMVRFQGLSASGRVENRLGASDANPYLLAASQLAAGLAGVRDDLDPGEPVTHNAAEDPAYDRVPVDLRGAIEALEADEVIVDALGRELCELYCSVQRLVLRRFNSHVTDWEITEYRDL